ncbi:uncharacterized protein METZ01_LOCUS303075, partial [marine metagenome]
MQLKIHNEGWIYLVSAIILTIIVIPFFVFIGIFFAILSIYIFYFFRDPNRIIPLDDFIVSPADGTITYIGETNAPLDIENNNEVYTKVSIFLSIFDVHVNR